MRISSRSKEGGLASNTSPSGSKFLYFHAVLGKNWSNSMLVSHAPGLGHPPLGNPGSAMKNNSLILQHRYLHTYLHQIF